MANQRQKGTKLAGAYIADDKDEALAALARKRGYDNKAAFIRALYDAALAEDAPPSAPPPAPAAATPKGKAKAAPSPAPAKAVKAAKPVASPAPKAPPGKRKTRG